MNERILSPQLLKLVQEAGPGYSLADPKWVKKFTELIVLECCNEITQEPFNAGSASAWLKKHFGVEE